MSERDKSILDFGQELIAARTSRGLTLGQIAEVTKVSLTYLRAMEEGEWELLPEPYMEAFLKAYAEAVGMNVPKVMKRYRETVHVELTSPTKTDSDTPEATKAIPSKTAVKKKSRAWVGYVIAAVALVAIGATACFVLHKSKQPTAVPAPVEYERIGPKPDSSRRAAVDTTSRLDSLGHKIDSLGALRVTPDSLLAAPKEVPTGIRLTGRAHRPCWVRANLDKRKIQDILLAPGDTIAWKAAREIELVVGNAGGLELVMDGRSLGVLGPRDKVVTVLITPEGIKSQKMGSVHLPPDSLLNRKETKVDSQKPDSTR